MKHTRPVIFFFSLMVVAMADLQSPINSKGIGEAAGDIDATVPVFTPPAKATKTEPPQKAQKEEAVEEIIPQDGVQRRWSPEEREFNRNGIPK